MYDIEEFYLVKDEYNVEIVEDEERITKWYIGVIKEVKDGSCIVYFEGFDSSRNIQVAEVEIPRKI